jgi:hypothetical protein
MLQGPLHRLHAMGNARGNAKVQDRLGLARSGIMIVKTSQVENQSYLSIICTRHSDKMAVFRSSQRKSCYVMKVEPICSKITFTPVHSHSYTASSEIAHLLLTHSQIVVMVQTS